MIWAVVAVLLLIAVAQSLHIVTLHRRVRYVERAVRRATW